MDEHAPGWMRKLDPRELAQVYHALNYAKDFASAGAPGHGQFLLIAKLARMLDEATVGVTAALSLSTGRTPNAALLMRYRRSQQATAYLRTPSRTPIAV